MIAQKNQNLAYPTEAILKRPPAANTMLANSVNVMLVLAEFATAKPGRKNVYLYDWVPIVSMNLAANALCGYIIKRTTGGEHIKIKNVTATYTTRAWIQRGDRQR
ncbi:uncharacterized protein CTHT_0023430 [Thermochaetoides thermophila DSM 1495]|uniref:Uncharacterized protein n=1 Tax=Chaetomium thermophilum (strain DSM 1495 / CBS 144.50 / IMI 039719) TaxID=759272 RepID=G0S4T2_CHATD|nr:hypothetical protein CTHT_0023430 [Thermochaetoides thermophila DSM 1495]EGS20511.1 hypothetical protein CTHT_0023430 [Thermochaetoides thermophila DSM 1495]